MSGFSLVRAKNSFPPLDRRRKETRLLTLLPSANRASKIQCMLEVISLESTPPPYPALSYTWGDPHLKREIELDGKPHDVTINLHDALLHLRKRDEKLVIWVDALCINQRDLQEQSHQVSLMHLVYGKAESVIVWLGTWAQDSDLAMDFIHWWGSQDISDADAKPVPSNRELLFTERNWNAVSELFKRPWWSRLWVFQEIVLAREAIVMCGEKQVDWMCFDRFAANCEPGITEIPLEFTMDWHQYYANERGTFMAIAIIRDAKKLRGAPMSPTSRNDFLQVLFSVRLRQASKARDKVFGMLGIMDLGADIDPDYNKSVEQVYGELMVLIFEKTKSLDHLTFAGWGTRNDHQCGKNCQSPCEDFLDLPSWTLDLRLQTLLVSEPNLETYVAALKSDSTGARFSTDLRELTAEGMKVDSVAALLTPTTSPEWGQPNFDRLLQWRAFADAERPEEYPTGISRLQTFYRMMMGDFCACGEKTAYGGMFLHYLTYIFERYSKGDASATSFPDDFETFYKQLGEPYPGREESVFYAYCGEAGDYDGFRAVEAAYNDIKQSDCSMNLNIYHGITNNRSFFTTSRGYMGMGPPKAELGDRIAVLKGCKMPMLIRKCEEKYRLVGACYVFGYMCGEAVFELDEGMHHVEDLTFI